jgi:outer membrane protein OmpA-like peptidoglycan-associated protein
MRAPFNSSWDDFNLVHRLNRNVGLFISNRNNAISSDDIYMFDNFPPKMIIFSGKVYDKETNEAITDYTVTIVDENGNKTFEQHVTGPDGYFAYLGPNQKYDITVTSKDYMTEKQQVSTAGAKNFTELSADTYMGKDVIIDKIQPKTDEVTGKTDAATIESIELELKDIFYEFDKFRLTEASQRELDKYIVYFHQYPNMVVEISSHTDSRGTYEYNRNLSDWRAKIVVDYFVSRGVSISQLRWHGYGKTQMMIPNARNEAEHQANRRTMFRVLNLGMENVSYRQVTAKEMLNSPGGAVDMSGWWLQVHESNNYRELDLPVVRRAGQLTGKEVRLIRSDDGRYRYCIQYATRADALREQVLLYKENIHAVLMQF